MYPDYNVNFLIVPAYTIPDIVFLFVCLFYGHLFSFTSRIVTCFVWMGTFLLFPFVTTLIFDSSRQDIGFYIILCVSAAAGITTATLQTAIMGFCNYLPVSYIQVNIAGQAMVGVIAGVTRIFINIIQQNTSMSTKTNGLIYFGVGGTFDLLCAVLFLYAIRKNKFVQFYLKDYFESKGLHSTNEQQRSSKTSTSKLVTPSGSDMKQNPIAKTTGITINLGKPNAKKFRPNRCSFDETELDGIEFSMSVNNTATYTGYIQVKDDKDEIVMDIDKEKEDTKGSNKESEVTVFGVYKKIKWLSLAIFLTFFVTFLPFPAMIVSLESKYGWVNDGNWMPVLLVLEFNFCDFIGRQVFASWTSCSLSKNTLWIGAAWRLLLFPIFVVLFTGVVQEDIFAIFAVAVLGITHGNFCCLAFMWAPSLVTSEEQQLCGSIMSVSLVMGITTGSYTTLALNTLGILTQ